MPPKYITSYNKCIWYLDIAVYCLYCYWFFFCLFTGKSTIKSKFFALYPCLELTLDVIKNTNTKILRYEEELCVSRCSLFVLCYAVQRETQFVGHGFAAHQTSPEDYEVPPAARGALAGHTRGPPGPPTPARGIHCSQDHQYQHQWIQEAKGHWWGLLPKWPFCSLWKQHRYYVNYLTVKARFYFFNIYI